jgi:hypothetical protein
MRLILTLTCAATCCLTAAAAEPAPPPKVEPELAPDKELLARIEALGDNTWMKLPRFKVIGELDWLSPKADERARGPFGRSYCAYAVWAPERKRALFMGGGHNVRRQSDVWEFDLAANAWICLRGRDAGGSQTNTEEWFRANTKMAEDGFIVTKDDGPVAVSHTWSQFCYDPERRVALWVNSMPRSVVYSLDLDKPDNVAAKGLGLPFAEFHKKLCRDGIYVWEFDPARRRFTRREFVFNLKRPGNTTGGRLEEGTMRYIPELKTTFFNGTLRDAATGEWKPIGAKGGPRYYPACGGDYDPKTRRLLLYQKGAVWALSIDTKEWKQVSSDGPQGCGYGFQYDPAAGEFIAQTWEDKKVVTWSFDTAKDQWARKPDPQGEMPAAGSQSIRWYDPDRNVHVYYNCLDVYVYRAKRIAK